MFELLSLMIFCLSLELCYHGKKIAKFINRDTLRKSCGWACWWLRGGSLSPSIGNCIWSITVKKEIGFHTWLAIIWFLLICKSKWCREVVSRKHKTSRSGRKWFICTLIKDAVIITASFIIEIFICTYFSLCLALVWYNVSHAPSLYIRTNQALIYICIFVFVYIQVLTEQ